MKMTEERIKEIEIALTKEFLHSDNMVPQIQTVVDENIADCDEIQWLIYNATLEFKITIK